MKKVVGLGASVLDTIIEMDVFPTEDTKKKADNVFTSGGGPVGNALVCIAKLGVVSSYLGVLSNDSNGHQQVNEFKQYNVDTSNIKLIDNVRAFTSYIILDKQKGTRTCVFDRGSLPDDPKLLNLEVIKDYDVLHLDGNFLNCAVEAAQVAKKYKVKVSLDAGSVYPNIEKLLPYVDILITSEEFAMKFTNKKDVKLAIKSLNNLYHPEVLVVTQGAKGGCYLENGEVKSYNSFKITCVDSNGAGDTFHGAFLVAYLNDKSVRDCCVFASATSAIKCQKAGVRIALPNINEVNQFLKERGE